MASRVDDEFDDYDDQPRQSREEYGPLDKLFMDTPFQVLIVFSLCCGFVALIMAAICFASATQPEAKSRALIVMIISIILIGLSVFLNVGTAFLR